jgi:hypothetical protein
MLSLWREDVNAAFMQCCVPARLDHDCCRYFLDNRRSAQMIPRPQRASCVDRRGLGGSLKREHHIAVSLERGFGPFPGGNLLASRFVQMADDRTFHIHHFDRALRLVIVIKLLVMCVECLCDSTKPQLFDVERVNLNSTFVHLPDNLALHER